MSAAVPSDGADRRWRAAAWIARLGRSDVDAEAHAGALRDWAESDPANADALADATIVWDELAGVGARYLEVRARRRRALTWAAAGLAAAACLAVTLALPFGDTVYTTPVGGERTVTLEDGSVIAMNTDTRMSVRYSRGKRQVILHKGEAYFRVARNPERPFVVTSGKSTVRALGTAFLVRTEGRWAGVTLVEGRVVIAPRDLGPAERSGARPVVLYPRQRWDAASGRVRPLSASDIEAALAWDSGQLLFDNATLAEAVAEFNRYTTIPIAIETENAAQVRISGVFNLSEVDSFTRAVSVMYGLKVTPMGDRILLSGAPDSFTADRRAAAAP